MRNTVTAAASALLLALTLTACSTGTETPEAGAPQSSAPAGAEGLLADFGLDGMGAVKIIDQLDRLSPADRPTDLMASVRPGELLVSAGAEEYSLEIPSDQFYLSTAPYVDSTHECFNHSLTTCMGELGSKELQVRIVDETNDKVLVDETTTTFENGFVGYWLPRDIEGTLEVTYDGKTGAVDFATDADAPTCVSTLQLT